MNRKEQLLAVLLKTFPAGSSLAFDPVFELQEGQNKNLRASLRGRDGIAQIVSIPDAVDLDAPTKWVAVMKQDGAGSPNLTLNDPDFTSRANIAKQAKKLTFGRPLYVLYFELRNA